MGYVGALVFCAVVAGLGVAVFASGSGKVKARLGDATGRWEAEQDDRQQRQFAGGFLVAAGAVGGLFAYVESFKAAVRSLLPITERTAEEVVAVIGNPTAAIVHDDGTTRLAWRAAWYSVVIAARDGKCVGIVADGDLG